MRLLDQLKERNIIPCNEAVEWIADKTFDECFDECHRGDWMLWLFAETNPDNLQLLTLAKGHCANTVRYLMKDKRSIAAVDAAIAFGDGNISREELKATTMSALAAANAAYAAYAAYAAAATTMSALAAANAAAYAAYAAAANAFYASARKQNQQQTADICRKYLPIEIWNLS